MYYSNDYSTCYPNTHHVLLHKSLFTAWWSNSCKFASEEIRKTHAIIIKIRNIITATQQYPAGWKFRWILREGYNNNINLESELCSQTERMHPLPLLHLPPPPMLCPAFQPPMVRIPWNIIGQVSLQGEESDKNSPDEQLWSWTPPSWISTDWRKTGETANFFSGWGRTGRKRQGKRGRREWGSDLAVLRGATGG